MEYYVCLPPLPPKPEAGDEEEYQGDGHDSPESDFYYQATKVEDVYEVKFDIHEPEWQFVEPPSEDFFCSLCKKLLKKPLLSECCGTHLCKPCAVPLIISVQTVTTEIMDISQCPNCFKKKVKMMPNKSKGKVILGIRIYCPLNGRGCSWTGEIREKEKHLQIDCPYKSLECINECGESVLRCEASEHLDNLCPRRSAVCQHCGEIGEFDNISNDHLLKCPEYRIVCPNDCGKKFKQVKFDEHMDKCPEFEIPCDFRFAGCNILLKRKCMPQHLLEKLEHHLELQSKTIHSSLEKSRQLFHDHAKESQKKIEEYASRNSLENECLQLEKIRTTAEIRQSKIKEKMNEIHDNHESTIRILYNKHTINLLWELDREQLQFETRITSGSLTEVWTGLQFGYRKVAIKKHKHLTTTSSRFLHEAYLMREF